MSDDNVTAEHPGTGFPTEEPEDAAPIRFETKIAVLLREDLQVWQRLNVCAFLMSGIAVHGKKNVVDKVM